MTPNSVDNMLWGNWENSIRDDSPRNTGQTELDRNAFLTLLITQLQHQDPLNPMENHEFIAQLAQFSSLEAMQELNTHTQRGHAFSLVGRDVMAEVRNPATGAIDAVVGVATSAVVINGNSYLMVEGPLVGDEPRRVSIDDIVFSGSDASEMLLNAINNSLLSTQNLALVGQFAQFVERDSDGRVTNFVEGQIDSLRFDRERGIILTVAGREVTASQVQEISSRPMVVGNTISGVPVVEGSNEAQTQVTGIITGIAVHGNEFRATVRTNETPSRDVQMVVGDIDELTAAMRTIGNAHTVDGETFTVHSVFLRAGAPWLRRHENDNVGVMFTGASSAPTSLIDRYVYIAAGNNPNSTQTMRGRITSATNDAYGGVALVVRTGGTANHDVDVRSRVDLNNAMGRIGRVHTPANEATGAPEITVSSVRIITGIPNLVLSNGTLVPVRAELDSRPAPTT